MKGQDLSGAGRVVEHAAFERRYRQLEQHLVEQRERWMVDQGDEVQSELLDDVAHEPGVPIKASCSGLSANSASATRASSDGYIAANRAISGTTNAAARFKSLRVVAR